MSNEALTFRMILEANGFDAKARKHIKLLRHPLNNSEVREIYDKDYIELYQSEQDPKIFKNCDYIFSFIGEESNTAKFIGCYKVPKDFKPCPEVYDEISKQHPNFPHLEFFKNPNNNYYDLQRTDDLSSLKNKLVIRWNNPISWHQWADNEFPVIAITSATPFPGYESISLSYKELKEIIEEKNPEWMNPLSKVCGVYLISSPEGLYIGSAYGDKGIWNRWEEYVKTKDGGNVELVKILEKYPNLHTEFRFSLLKVLTRKTTNEEVIEWENFFKKTHNTRTEKFGFNRSEAKKSL